MALLDDAAEFQQAQRKQEDRLQAARDAESGAWSSAWTVELRDILFEKGIRKSPLYLGRRMSEPVSGALSGNYYKWIRTHDTEFFGSVWLLRGWQNNDGGFSPINVALSDDGALWRLSTTTFTESLTETPDGRYATIGDHTVYYPDVQPAHRSMFVLLSGVSPRRAASRPDHDQLLRGLVGVPIVAAVQAGRTGSDGWIVAEQSDQIPGFNSFSYYSYY